jgi:hypothetical protein
MHTQLKVSAFLCNEGEQLKEFQLNCARGSRAGALSALLKLQKYFNTNTRRHTRCAILAVKPFSALIWRTGKKGKRLALLLLLSRVFLSQ